MKTKIILILFSFVLLASCQSKSEWSLGRQEVKSNNGDLLYVYYDVFGPANDTGTMVVTDFKKDHMKKYYFMNGVIKDTITFYKEHGMKMQVILKESDFILKNFDRAEKPIEESVFINSDEGTALFKKHLSWKMELPENSSEEMEEGMSVEDMMLSEMCEASFDLVIAGQGDVDLVEEIIQFNSDNKIKNLDDFFEKGKDENQTKDIKMLEVFEDDEWITCALKFDVYSCGATHPMYGTTYYNYSKTLKRIVPIKDLFPLENKAFLELVLDEYWKNYPNSDKNWQFAAPKQIARVEGGIMIHYNPYEVASFAQGEMGFFLSDEQVREFGIE